MAVGCLLLPACSDSDTVEPAALTDDRSAIMPRPVETSPTTMALDDVVVAFTLVDGLSSIG